MSEELDRSDMEYAVFAVQHQPILMAVARNLCGRKGNACDDVVQDVLLRALLKWDLLQSWSEPERRSWLVRVLLTCVLDQCRHQPLVASSGIHLDNVHRLFEEPDAPDPGLWESITAEELREAVAALPYNLRRTFELHSEGLRHADIGRELGSSAATVGTWLFHARHRLREQLHGQAERRRKLGSG